MVMYMYDKIELNKTNEKTEDGRSWRCLAYCLSQKNAMLSSYREVLFYHRIRMYRGKTKQMFCSCFNFFYFVSTRESSYCCNAS